MLDALPQHSVPDEALEFAGFVLAHCAAIADSNREGELICPFAIFQDDDGRQILDFESDTQEEAVAKGWASFEEAKSENIACAFGREGLFRDPDGTATDVLLVTVWIPGMEEHYTVGQHFGRTEDQAIYLIGAAALWRHTGENAVTVEHCNEEALSRGISNHPQGSRWQEWRGH